MSQNDLNEHQISWQWRLSSEVLEASESLSNDLKVLIDSSLILDIFLNRKSPYLEYYTNILSRLKSREIQGYITETEIERIWHISERLKGRKTTNSLISHLLNFIKPCIIDSEVILASENNHLTTLDNAIQVECLKRYNLDIIVSDKFDNDIFESNEPSMGQGIKTAYILTPIQFVSFLESRQIHENITTKENKLSKEIEYIKSRLNHTLTNRDSLVDEELSISSYTIDDFEISSSQNQYAYARVIITNQDQEKHSETAHGQGPVEALCRAVDKSIQSLSLPKYSLYSLRINNTSTTSKGFESPVKTTAILKCDKKFYRGEAEHADCLKSIFFAYIKAINNILHDIHDESYQNIYINDEYTQCDPLPKILKSSESKKAFKKKRILKRTSCRV